MEIFDQIKGVYETASSWSVDSRMERFPAPLRLRCRPARESGHPGQPPACEVLDSRALGSDDEGEEPMPTEITDAFEKAGGHHARRPEPAAA